MMGWGKRSEPAGGLLISGAGWDAGWDDRGRAEIRQLGRIARFRRAAGRGYAGCGLPPDSWGRLERLLLRFADGLEGVL
jgi:hypothetical protein